MTRIEEAESVLRGLSRNDKWTVFSRLWQDLEAEWDRQIEEDAAAGRLDELIEEIEDDIKKGKTRSLDEVVGDE